MNELVSSVRVRGRPVAGAARAAIAAFGIACFTMPATVHGSNEPAHASHAGGGVATQAALTLREAVRQALATHPEVRQSRAERETADQLLRTAQWGRYPSLSVDAGVLDSANRAPTVRLQQPVWAGGRIDAAIEGGEARARAAERGTEATRQSLAESVGVAFVRVSGSQERVRLSIEAMAELRELAALIGRRAAGGLASSADQRLAEARLDQAQAQHRELQAALLRARSELAALLSADVDAIEPTGFTSLPFDSVEALTDAVLAGSPARAQRIAEVEAARADARVRRGQLFPLAVVRLERGPVLSSNVTDNRAMLALQYQSDPGLAGWSAYQASAARIDAALAQVATIELDLRLKARSIWIEAESAAAQQTSLRALVEANEATVASFLRQYDAGRRGWLDVLNAQRELSDSRLALSRAVSTRLEASLRALGASGRLLPALDL